MSTSGQVRDVMTASPRTIGPDAPVVEAARMMLAEDVGSLPVVQDDRLLGVVTDRDIVLRVIAEERSPGKVTVAAVATRDVVTVSPEDRLDEALELMATRQLRRLPVVEGERRLVGVLAQADVARTTEAAETGHLVEAISEPTRR